MTRRARVTLGRRGPVVAVALAAVALGTLRALDPETTGGSGWVRETGGALALGATFLGASRGAWLAGSLLARARRRPPGVRSLRRAAVRSARAALWDAVIALALALPVLAAGWELGAPTGALLATVGAVVACLLGAWVAGVAAGATGLPSPAAAFAAAAVVAAFAWPSALRWAVAETRAFPLLELPAWASLLALLGGLSIGAWLLARRAAWAR